MGCTERGALAARAVLLLAALLPAAVACSSGSSEASGPASAAAGAKAGAGGDPGAGSGPASPGGAGGAQTPLAGNAAAGSGPTRPANAGGAGTAVPAAGAGAGANDAAVDAGVSADAGAPGAAPRVVTFHNGGFWNDAVGKRIEAHGGGFLQLNETWYWIGEDKSGNSAGFKAVNCYASQDLVRWELRNAIITRDTAPELAAADRIIERPKVIYNERTKLFVMWLHWEGQNYAEAEAGVFTSPTIDGDYTYRASFRPNGNMSRDDALFRDDDGSAYFVSAARENADLIVYQLSDDYLTIARQVSTLFAGAYREAPAIFKDGGRYYLITSGATGWDPNQAKYTSAPSMNGPWAALQNLGNATTFDTQSTYVLPVQGSKTTTYVYAGDRWQDPDLASSKYIWLPLVVRDGGLTLDYYPDWQLDLESGEWSADDGFIAQDGWSLLGADSEETSAENGRAQNAFDGSASTIWHTQYTGATPMPPHELRIDLGASYRLEAVRLLPRQDAVDHGIVAEYQFFVSDDPQSWGSPAASGSLQAGRDPKLVPFAARTGRYVRLVATREINGRAWTSLAELDLTGSR